MIRMPSWEPWRGMATVAVLAVACCAAPAFAGDEIDSPQALQALEARIRAVAATVRPAVVGLVSVDEQGVEKGSGSGTIISRDGWVLTAGHVGQQPGKRMKVLLADGTEMRGTTAGQHFGPDGDVGLVKIETGGKELPFAELGAAAKLATGDTVVAFGHPLGPERNPWRPPPLRVGRVIGREGWVLAIDAPLSPGDSGGPVFALDGTLVGVNSTASERPDLNTAATVESAQQRMESMREAMATGEYLADPSKDPVEVAAAAHGTDNGRDSDGGHLRQEQEERRAALLQMLASLTDPYADSIVSIIVDSRDAAYGVVVDDEGHVLTKASELGNGARRIDVLLGDGLSVPGKRLAVDRNLDLALLETGINDVTPVTFDAAAEPALGDAVISVGRGMAPLALGFRGLGPYMSGGSDAASRAYLGVKLVSPKADGPSGTPAAVGQVVDEVRADSAAAEAGIAKGDVILAVDGVPIDSPEAISAPVRSHAPGEEVSVDFMHAGERRTVKVRLLRPPFRDMRDAISQGAILSRRATGFGEVIAHDGIVPAQYMGGPVVDSGGHVVGVNIARADRMKTYALPARRVRASLEAMLARVKAGDVLPPEDPGAGLAVVEFAPDGFAHLGPKEGRVLGPTNTVAEHDGAQEIAGWGDSDDLAVWKLRLPEPGRYDLSLDVWGGLGGKVDVFFGDDLMTTSVRPSRGFVKVRVGESVSTEAEDVLVRVQPLGRPGGPMMRLRGITVQRTDQLRMAEAALPLLRWKDFERYKREWDREQRRKDREAARAARAAELKGAAAGQDGAGEPRTKEEPKP